VAERYGRDRVSQIITYGTMAAKAVIRDAGRVLGQPYGFVDRIAKQVPFEIGMTLEKALEQEPELAAMYREDDEVRSIIDLARSLEGLVRNAGKREQLDWIWRSLHIWQDTRPCRHDDLLAYCRIRRQYPDRNEPYGKGDIWLGDAAESRVIRRQVPLHRYVQAIHTSPTSRNACYLATLL
jgi:hypothetical protein